MRQSQRQQFVEGRIIINKKCLDLAPSQRDRNGTEENSEARPVNFGENPDIQAEQ